MTVTAYRTRKVTPGTRLYELIDAVLPVVGEHDIVAVTSKIISICEGNIIRNDGAVSKRELIKNQADAYLDGTAAARHNILLTIKRNMLIANAGIDESNGGGYCVLWPKAPQKSACDLWRYLRQTHKVKEIGVIITDSHTTPMRWGVTGVGLAWCGFDALKDYIGKPDIDGRKLHVTKANVLDGLSAAAVAVMGEGDEQTPLAVIRDASFVTFRGRPPTLRELRSMIIDPASDLYADLTDSPLWKKSASNGRSSIMDTE